MLFPEFSISPSGSQFSANTAQLLKNNLEDHIKNLVERHCLVQSNITTSIVTASNITALNSTQDANAFTGYDYGDATAGGNVENVLYCTECVPLPYEGILPPNALDWYSPLHWWDFGLIIVALSVQFRLKTIDDVSQAQNTAQLLRMILSNIRFQSKMGGSFGPLVVDEKDIAITSAHIMTIMISIFFYCIEVAISSLWISLHNSHDLLDDHASYYTGEPATKP